MVVAVGVCVCLQGALSVEERLRRAREALRLEKEAHARTRQKLEDLKRLVAAEAGVHPTGGHDMDRLSPTVPSTKTILVESKDSAEGVGGVDGDLPEQLVLGEGVEAPVVEPTVRHVQGGRDVDESDSPIANRARQEPCVRHPSILQSSPYVNPTPRVGKGKRACTKVYRPRKRATAQGVRQQEERPPPDVEGYQVWCTTLSISL